MFDVCIALFIHGHHSIYVFGDANKQCIHMYKKDMDTHYDVLLADIEVSGRERHCACFPPSIPSMSHINA
jgi:hypothetical protein